MQIRKNDDIKLEIFDSLPEIFANDLILYADGSYFTQNLPSEVEFVYIVLTNKGEIRRTLTSIYFELVYISSAGEKTFFRLDISFPYHTYYGKKVEINSPLIFACLREHLTASMRAHFPPKDIYLQASCETLDEKFSSIPQKYDINYPNSPLQDIELINYYPILKQEEERYKNEIKRIYTSFQDLYEYANIHKLLGIHLHEEAGEKYWLCKEYAPDAQEIYLIYDSDGYGSQKSFAYTSDKKGYFTLKVPYEAFYHGMYYELHIYGKKVKEKQVRVPAFANWVEQNIDNPNQWSARFYYPKEKYQFRYKKPQKVQPLIYEAHIGFAKNKIDLSSENERGFGTYKYFQKEILPKIKEAGFNTVQLMAIPEHPLYKSFGYQVSSYFAPSHRYGSLDEFKELVDTAHKMGLRVLLDIVHSHATSNTIEGLAQYDTGAFLFYEDKQTQWGTALFDYNKEMTRRFLLSNCRYWLEEFNVDGFRFDAVGTMVFTDEGFSDDFSHVHSCFYDKDNKMRRNNAGILYLQLANTLIHDLNHQNISIAEEFSGTPGITSSPNMAGLGFDYRFAMGIPDFWNSYITEAEAMWKIWHECTNSRIYDHTISYVECHDQSINGEDAMIWRLIGDYMYSNMSYLTENYIVSRGVALSKLMKLITFASADKGYMNFMGNEFGHPEWLDADITPYRQWNLPEDSLLHYKGLQKFNKDMLALAHDNLFLFSARLRLLDEEKKLILFERNNLLFAFNFHETSPSTLLTKVTTGKYREILSSDESKYAGHGNLSVKLEIEHFTKPETGVYEQDISLYLPPLTALILKRE